MKDPQETTLAHRPQPASPIPSAGRDSFSSAGPGPDLDDGGLDLTRVPAILWRYKWLLALCTFLGLGAGYFAATSMAPRYSALAVIQVGEPMAQQQGVTAIQTGPRFSPISWANLMRTNAVMERVVDELRLFIWPMPPAPRDLFLASEVIGPIRPGSYTLFVDGAGERVGIRLGQEGDVVESHELRSILRGLGPAAQGEGEEPDSTPSPEPGGTESSDLPVQEGPVLGASVGIQLRLSPEALVPGASIGFGLQGRRDAAMDLARGIQVQPSQSAFMTVMMQGRNAAWTARIVNAVTESFLQEAVEISRAQSDELSRTLEEQLTSARIGLNQAEAALEAFEEANVLAPSAGAGGGATPSGSEFMELQLQLEQLDRDRSTVLRILAEAEASGTLPISALEAVPSARESSELMQVLEEIAEKRAEARSLVLSRYTEDHPTVRGLREEIRELEQGIAPSLAREILAAVDLERESLGARVDARADELRQIPSRTLTQARLRRQVAQAEALYEDVNRRFSAARLAAISTTPDIQVVDWAEAPARPDGDRRATVALATLFLFMGAGGVGAILLDRRDRKLRSPSEVETRLGLTILGALPHLSVRRGRVKGEDHEQAVEAFRTIRLGLLYAYGSAGPTVITVSSPAPGDGKSFTCSNLALSFAELGRRTIVVDGDTRKGVQHTLLGVDRKPGLTDCLSGGVSFAAAVRPTDHPSLSVMPLGSLARSAPELLVSERMQELLAYLKESYEVILIDSPPLGAASDPLILGSLTGSMLIVLRNGVTDTQHAGAMLQNLRRYPVRILGAVLNDVPSGGEYRYYGYSPGYGIDEADVELGDRRELLGAGRA